MIEPIRPRVGADMGIDQKRFAFLNARVTIDQIGFAVAQRFNFAADENQSRFVGLVDEVVMARLAINADNLLARRLGFLSDH